jgi:predicted amidophosphoribosyltransferase
MRRAQGMARKKSRIEREKKTAEAMIKIYCSHHHKTKGTPCSECQALLEYAHARLDSCSFGGDKTTCAKCPVHCYKPEKREKVRVVMRYSGPRMIYHHPILAVLHIRDGFRKSKNASNENS